MHTLQNPNVRSSLTKWLVSHTIGDAFSVFCLTNLHQMGRDCDNAFNLRPFYSCWLWLQFIDWEQDWKVWIAAKSLMCTNNTFVLNEEQYSFTSAAISENRGIPYRRMLILRVTKNPMVTAGLMCPPLTCAITQTIVATLRPNANAIRTTSPVAHEPQATSTRSNVPMNSASNASQNLIDFTSSRLVVDILLEL